MSFNFVDAEREKIFLKIGIEGTSGSGKTVGAMLIAHGLASDWSRIGIIDCENRSALYYRDATFPYADAERARHEATIGKFKHLDLKPPMSPERYVGAIQAAAAGGIECLIIDSISHEWDFCLEWQTSLGGRYTDWKPVKAAHKNFMDEILQCKMHVICTMRSKSDYLQSEENGRKKIQKVGLKPIQQDQAEYEFGLIFAVDQESHKSLASKDRTGLFAPIQQPFFLSPEIGKTLKIWANEGKDRFQNRRESMLKAFKQFNINAEMLASLMNEDIVDMTEKDLDYLQEIWRKIKSKTFKKEELTAEILLAIGELS